MSEQPECAERALVEQFGDADAEIGVVVAPGRVNLIGGHTDYNEGFVLPTAIDRHTAVAGRPREDDAVNVHSVDLGESVTLSLGELRPREDASWANYVAGVFDRLCDRGYGPTGMDLAIASDVPIGAGVSSSAALEVATAGAIDAIQGLGLSEEEIATVAWEAETGFVGLDCGLLDQFAATFTDAGSALFLDCRSRAFERVPVDTDRAGILVVDTTVQHDLVDSAYNERVRQCEAGVEAMDRRLDEPIEALRDVDPETFEAHADTLSETVRKRCRHVIEENERVRAAAAALRDGDLETVGELMYRSHESLRDDYETSCEELDAVVEAAADHEAVFGARMTGAGFGGSVVALVRRDALADARDAIRTSYRDRTGIEPELYACEPAAGVREATAEERPGGD